MLFIWDTSTYIVSAIYRVRKKQYGLVTSYSTSINWDAVPGASSYDLEANGDIIGIGNRSTFTHTNLNANTQYHYRVRANNLGGPGNWSDGITVTTAPAIPMNIRVTTSGSNAIISWNLVEGATSYDIEIDGSYINNSVNNTFTHQGLTSGSEHNYRVRSKSNFANGDWSTLVKVLISSDIPSVPDNITYQIYSNSIKIYWNASNGATDYDIEADGVVINCNGDTQFFHDDLIPNTPHTYRVKANNGNGSSDWSNEINIKTKLVTPILSTSIISSNSITISWANIDNAINYELEVNGSSYNTISNGFTHSGLSPNTQYIYKVKAKNLDNESDWSEALTITTLLDTPNNINYIASVNDISITWDPVVSATAYIVEVDEISIDNGENTSFNHINLYADTTHKYRIKAKSLSNESDWSEIITVKTMSGMAGLGTMEDPYIITTKGDLISVASKLDAHYRLGNDIDLENIDWTPVGTDNNTPFKGSLDGAGYKIRNLAINKPTVGYIGLFGRVDSATLKNLTIENVNIIGKSDTGVLIGSGTSSNIENCKVTGAGSVSGVSSVGGLAGTISGNIVNCSSTVNVNGTNFYVGGLIGSGGSITNCYATGSVTTTGNNAGGLVGNLNGNIYQSYATGSVTGNQYVGGLVGYAHTPGQRIQNSFALGDVTSTNTSSAYAGGLVGEASSGVSSSPIRIENCYSIGSINGNGTLKGGLIGRTSYVTITNSYYDSTTTGITTPAEQSRTTGQMILQSNYTGWDFLDVWDMQDGSSYPYLRVLPVPPHALLPNRLYPTGLAVMKATPNSITLKWNTVQDATIYEIEANEIIIYSGPANTFEHTSLESGVEYTYRVRAKNDNTNMVSSWSPRFKAMTLLNTPVISTSFTDTSITISWGTVDKATSYEIEVDGTILNNGATTTYTHISLLTNSQHTYKVRAKNNITKSDWTEITSVINWSSSTPGICLAANNWSKDINSKEDVTVTLKANNVSNMYTMQFDLAYNPQILTLKTDSIINMMGTDAGGMYIRTSEDKTKGIIKVLISYTGNNQGKNGQFDILSITFGRKNTIESSIKVEPVKIVKPSGEYITIPQVSPLNIKVLPNS